MKRPDKIILDQLLFIQFSALSTLLNTNREKHYVTSVLFQFLFRFFLSLVILFCYFLWTQFDVKWKKILENFLRVLKKKLREKLMRRNSPNNPRNKIIHKKSFKNKIPPSKQCMIYIRKNKCAPIFSSEQLGPLTTAAHTSVSITDLRSNPPFGVVNDCLRPVNLATRRESERVTMLELHEETLQWDKWFL